MFKPSVYQLGEFVAGDSGLKADFSNPHDPLGGRVVAFSNGKEAAVVFLRFRDEVVAIPWVSASEWAVHDVEEATRLAEQFYPLLSAETAAEAAALHRAHARPISVLEAWPTGAPADSSPGAQVRDDREPGHPRGSTFVFGAPPPISSILAQGSQQNGGLQRPPSPSTGTGGSGGGTPGSTSTSPAPGAAGSAAHVGSLPTPVRDGRSLQALGGAGGSAQRAVMSPAANVGGSPRLGDAATHTQAPKTGNCRGLLRGNSVAGDRNALTAAAQTLVCVAPETRTQSFGAAALSRSNTAPISHRAVGPSPLGLVARASSVPTGRTAGSHLDRTATVRYEQHGDAEASPTRTLHFGSSSDCNGNYEQDGVTPRAPASGGTQRTETAATTQVRPRVELDGPPLWLQPAKKRRTAERLDPTKLELADILDRICKDDKPTLDLAVRSIYQPKLRKKKAATEPDADLGPEAESGNEAGADSDGTFTHCQMLPLTPGLKLFGEVYRDSLRAVGMPALKVMREADPGTRAPCGIMHRTPLLTFCACRSHPEAGGRFACHNEIRSGSRLHERGLREGSRCGCAPPA